MGRRRPNPTFRGIAVGMVGTFRHLRLLLQSTFLGTFIGALPGAGATIASFVSYTVAQTTSRDPERVGTGIPEGVVAPEAANSSNVGGALIPTFTLGIPGSGSTAVLLGAMMCMGLRPGPRLFLEQLPLIHTLGAYLLFGCLLIGLCGALAARYFNRITRISLSILVPCTIVAAALGAYSSRTEFFDIGVMLVMGVIGFLLQSFRYPLSAVVLGLVLGPMAEDYFIQSVEMTDWNLAAFFTRSVCIILWIGILLSVIASRVLAHKTRNTAAPTDITI